MLTEPEPIQEKAGDVTSETDRILSKNGNRLLLAEGILATVLLYAPLFLIPSLFSGFCSRLVILFDALREPWKEYAADLLPGALAWLWALFAALPATVGFFGLAEKIEKGERAPLSQIYAPFAGLRRYARTLSLSFGFLWRFTVLGVGVAVIVKTGEYFFAGQLIPAILCGFVVLAELFLGLWGISVSFSTLYFALTEPTCGIRECRRKSAEVFRMRCFAAYAWFWSYLPRLLLSVLTVGILFFWDVLPKMTLSYFRYHRKLEQMMNRTEFPEKEGNP